jgi:hypothetical protein
MTSTGFGWIKYKEKMYEHDIIVTTSGNVLQRDDEIIRKYGTHHAIGKEEMSKLLEGDPEIVFVGLGQDGVAKITDDAKELLMKSNSRLIEGITPNVIKKFDEFKGKKSALFHTTC